MKVKDLVEILKDFNPDAKVVLGSDSELNTLYPNVEVEILEIDTDQEFGNIELTPENVKKIRTIVISGHGYYVPKL